MENKNSEKILKYLKKKGKAPSSMICSELKMNYYKVLMLLEELEKNKIVVSELGVRGKYWKLKDDE